MMKVDGFKNSKVSEDLRLALAHILKHKTLPNLSDLNNADKEYLYRVMDLAKPAISIETISEKQAEKMRQSKIATKEIASKSKYRKMYGKLKLLVGESLAGNNNNPVLMKEATRILNSLVQNGILQLAEAEKIFRELH